MNWSAVSAVLLAFAVGIGAFGAHGLRGHISEDSLRVYETAVMYHFFHALGLLGVALAGRLGMLTARGLDRVAMLLVAGVMLFSGSLYLLAVTGVTTLGIVTPFGGLCFIAGWLLLAWELVRKPT